MKMLAIALILSVAAQDFDKSKHPWTRWKVDSYAKYKMTVEAGGGSFDGEYKSVLTEMTDKGYSAVHTSSFMGTERAEKETETFGEKKGEEKLKVGEKEHACVVWSSSGKRGEKETTAKLWMTGGTEVPVKMTWKSGDDDTGELTATKLADKIAAGGKEFEAVLLEGDSTSAELGAMKCKLWMHPSVPGGVVRMELAGDQAKIVIDLVDFDAKK